jgi:ATP-dependent DNA ligase
VPAALRPQPLIRIPAAFDHPDCLFELKLDGFRALAVIDHYTGRLVSRRGHIFTQRPQLCEEGSRVSIFPTTNRRLVAYVASGFAF